MPSWTRPIANVTALRCRATNDRECSDAECPIHTRLSGPSRPPVRLPGSVQNRPRSKSDVSAGFSNDATCTTWQERPDATAIRRPSERSHRNGHRQVEHQTRRRLVGVARARIRSGSPDRSRAIIGQHYVSNRTGRTPGEAVLLNRHFLIGTSWLARRDPHFLIGTSWLARRDPHFLIGTHRSHPGPGFRHLRKRRHRNDRDHQLHGS